MRELELIRLYFYLCECNDRQLFAYHQRFSNNQHPKNEKLDDVELLTIYLYCRCFEGRHRIKDIHDFANRYMKSWFPHLMNYQNFNFRLNRLCSVFQVIAQEILDKIQSIDNRLIMSNQALIDSMPIMLCCGKRVGKVARELSTKSYCATKNLYYYGLKLHVIAFRHSGKLPFPGYIGITTAEENDLEAIRNQLECYSNTIFYGDKAYADKKLRDSLQTHVSSEILTPIKLVKGNTEIERQFKKAADDLFSTAVSRIRQPIESYFNALIEKTGIQRASKVRNLNGLLLHVFGSITTKLLTDLF